ncbi:MAG: HAD-IC family P-type ATPase [Chitinophagales bacterium]
MRNIHFVVKAVKQFTSFRRIFLNDYYNIENNPGLKPLDTVGDFEFLELPEVREQLIQFEDEKIYRIKLNIHQIHCSSCIYLLEQLHQIDENIQASRVNFQRREIVLTLTKTEGILRRVFQLLSQLGYTPQIPEENNPKPNQQSKSLLIKIGIAGFCFGNIMLLSFPEYISGNSDIDSAFKDAFKYLIVLLVLPVLFYAAADYYKAAYTNLKHKYLSVDVPIVLGITALSVRSVYEMFYLSNPGYFDSLAGFIFFLLIGKWFQSRTYENLSFDKKYSSFFPLAVLKKVADAYDITRIKDLDKGDIIKLRNGEILPVNAQLLDDQAIFDYSFVTGESKTIVKQQKDSLFAGGKLKSANAMLMVTSKANSSYLQELWNNSDSEHPKGRTTAIIDSISQKFTIAIVLLAVAGFFFWYFNTGFSKALEVFTAILIVACPCALALAAPFTYGNAGRLLGKIDIYLKESSIIEQFGKIKTLIFDKTGTLTQKDSSEIVFNGRELDLTTQQDIKTIATCSIHPLSKSLVDHLEVDESQQFVEQYEEVAGKGIKATVRSSTYLIGSQNWLTSNGVLLHNINDNGRSKVYIGKDQVYIGYYELSNTYRDHILSDLKTLNNSYSIAIVSGDGNFEEQFLKSALVDKIQMEFNQSPNDKFNFVKAIREKNKGAVMMLGDGINDAVALKESDIGVAITEDTGSFTPNSDIIMHAKSLSKLTNMLQYGKDCNNILYACLSASILYNIIGLGFAFTGLLSPFVAAVLMPLSSISVVFLAVGLTNYFAHKRKIA